MYPDLNADPPSFIRYVQRNADLRTSLATNESPMNVKSKAEEAAITSSSCWRSMLAHSLHSAAAPEAAPNINPAEAFPPEVLNQLSKLPAGELPNAAEEKMETHKSRPIAAAKVALRAPNTGVAYESVTAAGGHDYEISTISVPQAVFEQAETAGSGRLQAGRRSSSKRSASDHKVPVKVRVAFEPESADCTTEAPSPKRFRRSFNEHCAAEVTGHPPASASLLAAPPATVQTSNQPAQRFSRSGNAPAPSISVVDTHQQAVTPPSKDSASGTSSGAQPCSSKSVLPAKVQANASTDVHADTRRLTQYAANQSTDQQLIGATPQGHRPQPAIKASSNPSSFFNKLKLTIQGRRHSSGGADQEAAAVDAEEAPPRQRPGATGCQVHEAASGEGPEMKSSDVVAHDPDAGQLAALEELGIEDGMDEVRRAQFQATQFQGCF